MSKNCSTLYAEYLEKVVPSLRLKTIIRREIRDGHFRVKPRILVLISESRGRTDYVRLVCPVMMNEAMDDTATFCIPKLIYGSATSPTISERVFKYFNLSILVSREKIDDVSFRSLKRLKRAHPEIPIIVDIDDDLFAIDNSHPEYNYYKARLATLKELIELSDSVVASTNKVLDGIKNAGCIPNDATVIPNFLDSRLWGPANCTTPSHHNSDNETIRILYSGTETHDADLRLLQEPLKRAIKRVRAATGKKLSMTVVGGSSTKIPGMEIIRVPDEKRDYPLYAEWVQSMPRFDFAVAPLDLSNKLNHAKSYLKYLEYSAMGLPSIFTRIEPYEQVVDNGVNGILVSDNSTKEWEDAIFSLSVDNERRYNMSLKCREDVLSNHLLRNHYGEWAHLITRLT